MRGAICLEQTFFAFRGSNDADELEDIALH
jgi:hypothetical protein